MNKKTKISNPNLSIINNVDGFDKANIKTKYCRADFGLTKLVKILTNKNITI